MNVKTVWRTIEISCGEERRKARLLTEWTVKDGKEILKGVICDNPRLAQEEPYDCAWSCWKLLTGGASAILKKTSPPQKATPPKEKATSAKKKVASAKRKSATRPRRSTR